VPLEKRTRVEIFLPIRTESVDYRAITDWLAEELAYSRGGSTMTSPVFCDFDLDAQNSAHFGKLTSYLDEVRSLVMEALDEEEVWIVYHPVTRVAGEQS